MENAEVGKALSKIVEDKGVKIISWVWQAGGVARAASSPYCVPDDVKGMKIRGGSREMDLMFTSAGGQVSTMPSNEIYIGMQTSALDAAMTSSTSLISFRLEELAKIADRRHARIVLVHAGAAAHVQGDFRQPDARSSRRPLSKSAPKWSHGARRRRKRTTRRLPRSTPPRARW